MDYITTLAIAGSALVGIVLLAVLLASSHRSGGVATISNRQYARNRRMVANLRHEGVWERPIIDNRK